MLINVLKFKPIEIQVKVKCLDEIQNPYTFTIKKTDTGVFLFDKVCEKLGNLIERDYFGLRYTDKNDQRQWLKLDKSVYKQLKGSESFSLSFRVKHYPADPLHDLKQNISRYLLYLQIRRDLNQGRLSCFGSFIGQIGALVAQAELGDAVDASNINLTKIHAVSNPLLKDNDIENGSGTCSQDNSKQPVGDECLQKLKIFLNQTPQIEEEIVEEYVKLRGLTIEEAETELLNRVTQLPTYGIEPFLVTIPSDVKCFDNYPVLTKDLMLYLGLSHTGIVTFVGRQRRLEYSWSQIRRLACDGNRILIFLKKEGIRSSKLKFWNNVNLVSFCCQSKLAALAFWQWAIDRQCFFTLKNATKAKRMNSSITLFKRNHSFYFGGQSQNELRLKTANMASIPQPNFVRASSLRRTPLSNKFKNMPAISETMPTRIKLKNMDSASVTDMFDSMIKQEESIDKRTPVSTDSLIKETHSKFDYSCDEPVVVNGDRNRIETNGLGDVGKQDTLVMEVVNKTDEKPEYCNQNGTNDHQIDEVEPISHTIQAVYQRPYTMVPNEQIQHVYQDQSNVTNMSQIVKPDGKTYNRLLATNSIDSDQSAPDSKLMNGTGNLLFAKNPTKPSLSSNGMIKMTNPNQDDADCESFLMKIQDKVNSSNIIKPMLIVSIFMLILSLFVILEFGPKSMSRQVERMKPNLIYYYMRNNWFMMSLDQYVYNPVRSGIISLFHTIEDLFD